MDYQNTAAEFHEQGYIVFDNFFEPELMDRIDRNVLQHFGTDPDFWHKDEFINRSRTEVVPWFPQNPDLPDYSAELAEPFDRLEADTRLQRLTEAVLGEAWGALYSMVMFSAKGTTGQAWHQDCPPENPERFNLNRLVYTRDISAEVGGQTVVVPGSHRRGAVPVGEPHGDLEGQVVLKPRKGTLVLLHGHAWHRVLPITGGYRFSTNLRACPEGTPADITDICVYRNMRYSFSEQRVVEER